MTPLRVREEALPVNSDPAYPHTKVLLHLQSLLACHLFPLLIFFWQIWFLSRLGLTFTGRKHQPPYTLNLAVSPFRLSCSKTKLKVGKKPFSKGWRCLHLTSICRVLVPQLLSNQLLIEKKGHQTQGQGFFLTHVVFSVTTFTQNRDDCLHFSEEKKKSEWQSQSTQTSQ